MAFSFNTNLSPASDADAIFQLKAVLKTALWVVKSSSDGTTFSAVADQITTGIAGAGGMANVGSWFRIQSPAGAASKELVFERRAANSWRIKYSLSAGFTGGTPGATQVPSATDEGVILGSGTDAAPTGAAMFSLTSLFRWHTAADGAAPYAFWAAGYANGGGAQGATNQPAVFIHDPMTSGTGETADTDPTMFICSGVSGTVRTQGQLSIFSLACSNGAGQKPDTAAWHLKGLTGAAFIKGSGAGTGSGVYGILPWAYYNSGAGGTFPSVAGGTSATGQILMVTSVYSSKDNLLPVMWGHMTGSNTTTDAVKGVSSILRHIGASTRNNGDTYTVTTSRDFIIIDQVCLPWDGTIPTV